jgi:hypothetical protein
MTTEGREGRRRWATQQTGRAQHGMADQNGAARDIPNANSWWCKVKVLGVKQEERAGRVTAAWTLEGGFG